jgi:hypothetical protein
LVLVLNLRVYKLGKEQICFSLRFLLVLGKHWGKSDIKGEGERIPFLKSTQNIIWEYLNKECVEFI